MYYNYNYVNVDVHADLQTVLSAIVWALCKLVIYCTFKCSLFYVLTSYGPAGVKGQLDQARAFSSANAEVSCGCTM